MKLADIGNLPTVPPKGEDRIEEAARETIADLALLHGGLWHSRTVNGENYYWPWDAFAAERIVRTILQRLYDDGKKAGAEERDCAVCKARGEYGG